MQIRIPCLRLLYACASRFEAKLDAALAKLDEILAQLAGQDRKLDRITDQLARLQEPSPLGKLGRGAGAVADQDLQLDI